MSSVLQRSEPAPVDVEAGRWMPWGTLEALKWLALGLMVLDHLNKYLAHGRWPGVFEAGRIVFPLFALTLCAGMARKIDQDPETGRAVVRRVMVRLTVAGLVASVPYIALGRTVGAVAWGWWPLNVMFTWLAGIGVVALWDLKTSMGRFGAGLVFGLAGALVEFAWPGLAVCAAAWALARRPDRLRWGAWIACVGALSIVNRNAWALGAVPVALVAYRVDLQVPRVRWLFYIAYPAHLTALAACTLWWS